MKVRNVTIPADLKVAADKLGQSLRQAEPVARYHQAKACLSADAHASALLRRLADVQADLRRRQSDVTDADIDRLRRLQQEAEVNPTIMALVQGQSAATAYLREVNQYLSELLGLDFSALAKRGGCC